MTTTSASRAEASGRPSVRAATPRSVLVWDWPVRVFHWLLALSFAGAWLTSESERWQLVHVTLGYTMGGLIAFRLVWGLVGSRPARFTSFVRGPQAVRGYLTSLRSGRPDHHTGHNPAGALAVLGLLGLGALTVVLGWSTFHELGGDWVEEAHEVAASSLMALVVIHLVGVLVSSALHRENLVRAMVTGLKQGRAAEGASRAWAPLGVALLAAVIGFWVWQWRAAPTPDTPTAPVASALQAGAQPLTADAVKALVASLVQDDDGDDD